MYSNKKNTNGLLFITIGLLLIAIALILVLYNIWDADRAKKASDHIVEELEKKITDAQEEFFENDVNQEMPIVEIDGQAYIGIIEIPSLNLSLPVMEEWDYERLKISPCRYSGSYFTDDLVICGHNYAKHFSPIKWIDIGSDVYFTTVDRQVYHYQVSNRETVQPTAIEEMIDHTKEGWDMTLFTCNTGGQTRCAVRCIKVK